MNRETRFPSLSTFIAETKEGPKLSIEGDIKEGDPVKVVPTNKAVYVFPIDTQGTPFHERYPNKHPMGQNAMIYQTKDGEIIAFQDKTP